MIIPFATEPSHQIPLWIYVVSACFVILIGIEIALSLEKRYQIKKGETYCPPWSMIVSTLALMPASIFIAAFFMSPILLVFECARFIGFGQFSVLNVMISCVSASVVLHLFAFIRQARGNAWKGLGFPGLPGGEFWIRNKTLHKQNEGKEG